MLIHTPPSPNSPSMVSTVLAKSVMVSIKKQVTMASNFRCPAPPSLYMDRKSPGTKTIGGIPSGHKDDGLGCGTMISRCCSARDQFSEKRCATGRIGNCGARLRRKSAAVKKRREASFASTRKPFLAISKARRPKPAPGNNTSPPGNILQRSATTGSYVLFTTSHVVLQSRSKCNRMDDMDPYEPGGNGPGQSPRQRTSATHLDCCP
mmetsp:Transcript_39886/g.105819  ORF Transcript_39886/g.105819 Transcript_39886/m.105819 type:complete len:207 (-) Transcript_39886:301-921(-)